MIEQDRFIYEFGPFHLDTTKRVLMKEGEPVKLFPKEFDTLVALVQRSGEVLEKDELMQQVWGDTAVEESNLTTNISHLRKLLGENRNRHDYIVTVPGKGYQFVAGVKQRFDEVAVHERVRVTVEEEEVADAGGDSKRISNKQSRHANNLKVLAPPHARIGRNKQVLYVTAAALTVAALVFVSYEFFKQRPSGNERAAPFSEIKLARVTNSGATIRAAISPDGRYVVHATETADGQSLWVRQVATSSNVQIVPPSRVEYQGLTFSPDGNYVYCVVWDGGNGDTQLLQVPALGGLPRKLPAISNSAVSFSPDGNHIAYVGTHASEGETQLLVAKADGTEERLLARRKQPDFYSAFSAPSWSPDGKVIACAYGSSYPGEHFVSVVGVRVEDGKEIPITSEKWHYIGQLAWLAEDRGLVLAAKNRASTPVQVWHVSYPAGVTRKITNDLNDYGGVSVTADSAVFVTVQKQTISTIWVADDDEAVSAKQIRSEVGEVEEIAWTPDGRIVYCSREGGDMDVWVVGANGSNPKQLTLDASAGGSVSVSPDGRYLVFAAARAGNLNIWRADLESGNLKRLTTAGGEIFPRSTPDSKWVVYQRGYGSIPPTLWKIPMEGGESVQLTETHGMRPTVSPDGKLIAYFYMDHEQANSQWKIGIISSNGGAPLKSFDVSPTVFSRIIRWAPGGRALAYVGNSGGISNIWLQPLTGEPPRQLTEFKEGKIGAFEWTRDGKQLALVRVAETSDAVLITQRQ